MATKLKVLFDANSLIGQKTGIGFYTEHIIKSLEENYGEEVMLTGYYFNFLGRGQKPPELSSVVYKPVRWFPRQLLSLARRCGFQIPLFMVVPSSLRFDVAFFPDFVALPLLKVRGVIVIHDLCFIDHPEYVAKRNVRFLQRFVPRSIAAADGVVAVSKFTEQRITQNFKKILTAPVIVAPDSLDLQSKNLKPHDSSSPVLYVGTIEPRKNLENLLEAYSRLPAELQQKHPLWLAGHRGWKDEKIIAKFNELKVRHVPVEYKGYVSAEEKAQFYAQSAAVVLVSHYEGFGMPILEAMAAGKPLLLSDIPVFSEVAGQAAAYCSSTDPDNIARKLEEVLTTSASTKMALYPSILQKFTWQKSADNILKLFQQVVE